MRYAYKDGAVLSKKESQGVEKALVGKAKDWFPNDKATHEWLNSMNKSTRSTYQSFWRYFVKFTGMTGDQTSLH